MSIKEYEAIVKACDQAKLTQEQRDIIWAALAQAGAEDRKRAKYVSVAPAMQAINKAIAR